MKKSFLWIPLILLMTILLSGCPGLFNTLTGGGDDSESQADLAVGAIEFSVDTATGQVTGVEFIITNNGDAPALNADYLVVLSSNQVVGTNSSDDITVFEDTITVAAGGQEAVALTTEIQDYITTNGVSVNPADYYVGVILDPGEDVDESNEQNNTGVSSSTGFIGGAGGGGGGGGDDTPDVDLTVNSVAFNLDQQQELVESVSIAFANTGSADANDVEFRFFLSADASPDAQDTRVYAGAVNVAANGTQTVLVTFDEIAAYIQTNNISYADGTYYGIAGIDPGNNVAETNEDNNFEVTSGTQFLSGTSGGGGGGTGTEVDLQTQSVAWTYDGQGNLNGVTVTFFNSGNDGASSVPFDLYFSTDASYESSDVLVFSGTIASIGPQTDPHVDVTLAQIETFVVDNGIQYSANDYHAVAYVDPEDVIPETNNGNNTGATQEPQALPASGGGSTPGGTTFPIATGPTITGLSSLGYEVPGTTPDEAVFIQLDVQYEGDLPASGDQAFYQYPVIPGAPYELFDDDDFEGSGTYSGDVQFTLLYNPGTGFVRNFAGASSNFDFDAIHPGGTTTAQGAFVAPPTTQQVLRASIEFQQGGTYGFGMVQNGPYLWGDFVTETYPTEALTLDPGTGSASEETTYVVSSSATSFHSISINPPASGEFTSERYARLWLEDSTVNTSFAADVQMSIWYSTDNGSSFDQITSFAGGTEITAGTEVDDTSGVPAVIRIPDGTTNMRLDFEGWNNGEANGLQIFPGDPPGSLDLYGFAIDFYGGDGGSSQGT